MKLTGKTKEAFEEWLKQQQNIIFNRYNNVFVFMCKLQFYDLPESIQSSYIIKFFDSVGVYISTDISTCYSEFDFNINMGGNKEFNSVYNKNTGTLFYNCKSRQEATDKAIEKANEIFNNKLA